MTSEIIIRLDPDLKDKVTRLAQEEGKTVNEIVRELLEEYVHNRDIDSYVDDLWERIGKKLRAQGVTPGDVERSIQEVRRQT